MKKKLILAGAAMLLTAAAVTGFSAYNKTDASDLLNANVEALTRGEGGEEVNCAYKCQKRDCGYVDIGGTIFTLWWCI